MKKIRNNTLIRKPFLYFVLLFFATLVLNCSSEEAKDSKSSANSAICGDGTLDSGESCDDGNTIDGDGCQANCALPTCGDGIVDSGEACDAGASNSDGAVDACRTTCVLAYCGDGIVDTGEACDDSNALDDGNGCASNCSANATASASAYTAAPNWNDYVRASDGVTPCDGTETGGYDQCIHGGENRVLTLDGQSSCEGITATDVLGAFNWLCRVNAGQAEVYSTSLADGKYLSDLIDWSASPPVWRPNSITVTMTGGSLTTAFSVWYGNTIVENTTGGSLTDIDADGVGEIYAVTANPAMPITIDASKLALVIKPGVTMTGSATTGESSVTVATKYFIWIEGAFDATGDSFAIQLLTAKFVVLSNIDAFGTPSSPALYLTNFDSSYLKSISIHDTAIGLFMDTSDNNIFNEVRVNATTNTGVSSVYLMNSTGNHFTNIVVSNSSQGGISIDSASPNNRFENVVTNSNAGVGLNVASANNTFTDVVASDNGGTGINVTAAGNRFFDVVVSNNSGAGFINTAGVNSIVTNLMLTGNSSAGYALEDNSNGSMYNNATVVNSAAVNTAVSMGWKSMLSNAIVANTSNEVVWFLNTGEKGANLAISDNPGATLTALYLNSGAYITGLLKVGNNAAGDCTGGVGAGINNDCTPEGPSDHILSTGITTANTFVGLISEDDTTNPNDTAGVALYDDITDWANFDNPFRTWGKAETANPFPSVDYQGACTTGTNCQIWDWRLKAGDTGDNGGAVALAVLTMHDNGNAADTITHSWSGAAALQTDCDTLQAGSVFVTDHCESIFLRNATEIMNDGLGNDNGLCESNETCMYTPNIGAYQGHGNIISAGTFTDGDTLTGITLMKYEENGI